MRFEEVKGNYTVNNDVEISDEAVVRYAKKHLRFIDRLSPRKVALASLISHPIVCGLYTNEKDYLEEPYKFKFIK